MKKHLAVILSVLLALGTASPVSAAKLKKNQVENIAAREEQAAMDAVSGPAAGEAGDKPSEVTGKMPPVKRSSRRKRPPARSRNRMKRPPAQNRKPKHPLKPCRRPKLQPEPGKQSPRQSREERRERISGPSLPPATPIRTAARAPTARCPGRSTQSPQTGMSFRPGPGSASATAISFTLWRTPGCTETGWMSIILPTARPGATA